MKINNIKIFLLIFFLALLSSGKILAERQSFTSFKELAPLQNEEQYIDFLREIILEQPEFSYANFILNEARMNLKYSRRQRFPELSIRLVNDEILSRKIKETNAIRKIRDDSFDGVVEIRQALYAGGGINAGVRKAKESERHIALEKRRTVSELIYNANNIYMRAISSSFLFNHANNIFSELDPYLAKVKARVDAGLADPIEYALFSVRYNNMKTMVNNFEATSRRDISLYENFFGRKFANNAFPKLEINDQAISFGNSSFDVEIAKSEYKESIEDITITKSEYRPQLGLSARFTKYDIDDDLGDEDVRGGIYFSYPIFDFGRSSARVAGSKAKSRAARSSIDVEIKKDLNQEAEYISILESSIRSREQIYQAFIDTQRQRKIISKRIEVSGFVAPTLAETATQEIVQLQSLLETEISILGSYFGLLHQNQELISRVLMVF